MTYSLTCYAEIDFRRKWRVIGLNNVNKSGNWPEQILVENGHQGKLAKMQNSFNFRTRSIIHQQFWQKQRLAAVEYCVSIKRWAQQTCRSLYHSFLNDEKLLICPNYKNISISSIAHQGSPLCSKRPIRPIKKWRESSGQVYLVGKIAKSCDAQTNVWK